ncbi:MATE family efflux transporter [Candidatus Marinimicrobia bacterium]|nr:MATE family efflux transporter [Candidatus Neomarinimicrobiota bacterium]
MRILRFVFPQNKPISKEVMILSYPIILSNLSRVLMSLIDLVMVGHLGVAAIAATGMGGMVLWGALSVVLGIRTAVQTVTSRRVGQKKYEEVGIAFRNGLIMATVYGLPISIVGCIWAKNIIPFFINDVAATPLAINYVSIISISLLFSAYSFVFQGFYNGIEKTKIHLVVTVISNLINLYLNIGLIYGSIGVSNFFSELHPKLSFLSSLWVWLDFPALGVKGAAIATLVASVWMSFHYSFYLFSKTIKNRFHIFSLKGNREMFRKQVVLAAPQGVQETVIALGWSVFYKIVGMIGLIELATTQVLFTIMHASFMPALGVGQACSTLVSKYMGEKKISKAEDSIKESVRLAEYIMGTMGLTFIFFPEFYLSTFTSDVEIITMGKFGLRMLGTVQFLDAIGFILWFALSGAGNTIFPALVESALVWIIVVLGSYFFGFHLGMGFKILWVLFPLYMGLFALIMIWKVREGDWKRIEV